MVVYGIDGCKRGWVAISKDLTAGKITWQLLHTIDELTAIQPAPDVIALDIPIGLTERGSRACDVETRRLLGYPRGSSVFPAPIRPVLSASNYAEACLLRMEAEGKKMSQQAWGIVAKIREVDEFLRNTSRFRDIVREVHPELSFYLLAGHRPMLHSKHTAEGRLERRSLLTNVFAGSLEAALAQRRSLGSQEDDVLDAFAALWSAERIAASGYLTIPSSPPPLDSYELAMQILA